MQKNNRHGIVTISYTDLGELLQARLSGIFREIIPGESVFAYSYRNKGDAFEKTEDILDRHFDTAQLILFISAAGIAVRKIAPYLKSKTTDPAVLCMDESGRFVIPLVSGHLGGANAWATKIAEQIGATAVITTATDGRGVFAVDLFAKENGLLIEDSSKIKEVSSRLLAGERVGICSDYPIGGNTPEGLLYCKIQNEKDSETKADREGANTERHPECGITITEDANLPQQFAVECRLIPKNLFFGIGCRKGTKPQALEQFVKDMLAGNSLDIRRVCAVASIDIKKNEAAIIDLAEKLGVPFWVYSAEKLKVCKGKFTKSAFVEAQVGVDNVCERSAVCAAEEGSRPDQEKTVGVNKSLILKKTVGEGMTLSVAASAVCIEYSK